MLVSPDWTVMDIGRYNILSYTFLKLFCPSSFGVQLSLSLVTNGASKLHHLGSKLYF
jgi:hypothetical protein